MNITNANVAVVNHGNYMGKQLRGSTPILFLGKKDFMLEQTEEGKFELSCLNLFSNFRLPAKEMIAALEKAIDFIKAETKGQD